MWVKLVIRCVWSYVGGAGDQVCVVSWVELVIRWVWSHVSTAGDQVGGVLCGWSW